MGAFVDADAASNAKALGDVRLAGVLVQDDAFLPVANWWAVMKTFVIAFLWLTIVFLQNSDPHLLTLPLL